MVNLISSSLPFLLEFIVTHDSSRSAKQQETEHSKTSHLVDRQCKSLQIYYNSLVL